MRALRIIALSLIGVLVALSGFGGAMVAAAAANLSHSYKSASAITAGSLVSLDPQHSGYVLSANNQNGQHLLGVAVSSDDSLLAVNAGSGEVQVALSGMVSTLVSTLNGPISIGEQIAVSPVNGVGMGALPGSEVVGIAQADFSAKSGGAEKRSVTNRDGQSSQIVVGYVPLSIAIGVAPGSGSQAASNFVQRLANTIAGRPVSTLSITISGIIALVAIVSVITLVYGTIRGSLISIGRNPLAKPAIFESLAQVIGMATLIVAIAVIVIYLILH